ncbi:MAG: hypothetical protein RR585_14290 [Coprobacillus sp.]
MTAIKYQTVMNLMTPSSIYIEPSMFLYASWFENQTNLYQG